MEVDKSLRKADDTQWSSQGYLHVGLRFQILQSRSIRKLRCGISDIKEVLVTLAVLTVSASFGKRKDFFWFISHRRTLRFSLPGLIFVLSFFQFPVFNFNFVNFVFFFFELILQTMYLYSLLFNFLLVLSVSSLELGYCFFSTG